MFWNALAASDESLPLLSKYVELDLGADVAGRDQAESRNKWKLKVHISVFWISIGSAVGNNV
jgi:hypothetical protein